MHRKPLEKVHDYFSKVFLDLDPKDFPEKYEVADCNTLVTVLLKFKDIRTLTNFNNRIFKLGFTRLSDSNAAKIIHEREGYYYVGCIPQEFLKLSDHPALVGFDFQTISDKKKFPLGLQYIPNQLENSSEVNSTTNNSYGYFSELLGSRGLEETSSSLPQQMDISVPIDTKEDTEVAPEEENLFSSLLAKSMRFFFGQETTEQTEQLEESLLAKSRRFFE